MKEEEEEEEEEEEVGNAFLNCLWRQKERTKRPWQNDVRVLVLVFINSIKMDSM